MLQATPHRSTKPVHHFHVGDQDAAPRHLGTGEGTCYKACSVAGVQGTVVGKGDGRDRRFIQVAFTG